MAVKQYIGARYVPKIEGDYNENRAYEPLSIVTYNLSSYTSKKAVPVGVLPTNTEYWAITGNYNGQVEQYRQEVEEIKEVVDKVKPLVDRKYLIIADSFADVPVGHTFVDYLSDMMGLTNNIDYVVSNESGSGIVNGGIPSGKNYEQRVTDLAATMSESEKNSFTDILVVGGTNDLNPSYTSTIGQAALSLASKLNELFPNAIIHSMFCATCFRYSKREMRNLKSAIRNGWNKIGELPYGRVCNKLDVYIADARNYINDSADVHPNEEGSKILANAIKHYLDGNQTFVVTSAPINWKNKGIIFRGVGTDNVTIEANNIILGTPTAGVTIPTNSAYTIYPVTSGEYIPYYPAKNVGLLMSTIIYSTTSATGQVAHDVVVSVNNNGAITLFNYGTTLTNLVDLSPVGGAYKIVDVLNDI